MGGEPGDFFVPFAKERFLDPCEPDIGSRIHEAFGAVERPERRVAVLGQPESLIAVDRDFHPPLHIGRDVRDMFDINGFIEIMDPDLHGLEAFGEPLFGFVATGQRVFQLARGGIEREAVVGAAEILVKRQTGGLCLDVPERGFKPPVEIATGGHDLDALGEGFDVACVLTKEETRQQVAKTGALASCRRDAAPAFDAVIGDEADNAHGYLCSDRSGYPGGGVRGRQRRLDEVEFDAVEHMHFVSFHRVLRACGPCAPCWCVRPLAERYEENGLVDISN